jgi:hypothetical protein
MKLITLLHAEDTSDIPTSKLTLETLGTGFPNAIQSVQIFVTPKGASVYAEAGTNLKVAGKIAYADHHQFIADQIAFASQSARAEEPLIFLDGDLIFFDEVETLIQQQIDNENRALVLGQRLPVLRSCGMNWIPRLHTSLYVVANPKRLIHHLSTCPWNSKWTSIDWFKPQVVFEHGNPNFYDTGANLYQALPDLHGGLNHEINKRYAHLFCGGSLSVARRRLGLERTAALAQRHHAALTDPMSLVNTNQNYEQFMFR